MDEMIQRVHNEPSKSPWCAPVVLVNKKDGTQRFCIDYRKLNNVTKKDSYPLPRIDITLDALGGSKWFTTIDLQSAFWQVEMDLKTVKKLRSRLVRNYGSLQSCRSGSAIVRQHFNDSWS